MRRQGTRAYVIPAETSLGAVRLTVADLDQQRRFYQHSIGLHPVRSTADAVQLGADGAPLVELVADPDAPPRPPGTTGLFHFAILLPSRAELARALRRVPRSGWQFTGASDHLVSEALYLNDPEGNGIEIYRDRPREEWSYTDGQLDMATLPLDVAGVASELAGDEDGGVPADTRIGHVHLNVAQLPAAEEFYGGVLGLDVTVRGYPGALFLSAGGYHHHVGLNTWSSAGGPAPPPGARGLRWFEVVLPSRDDVERIAVRVEGARRDEDGVHVTDPFGVELVLRTA